MKIVSSTALTKGGHVVEQRLIPIMDEDTSLLEPSVVMERV